MRLDGYCLPFPVKAWLWPCATLEPWEPCIHHLWIHPGKWCLQPRPHHLPPFLCLPEAPALSLFFLQKYVKVPQNLEALLSLPAETICFSSPHNLWPVALPMSPWHVLAWDLLLGMKGAKGRPRQ